jgi:hypothetical protein
MLSLESIPKSPMQPPIGPPRWCQFNSCGFRIVAMKRKRNIFKVVFTIILE